MIQKNNKVIYNSQLVSNYTLTMTPDQRTLYEEIENKNKEL